VTDYASLVQDEGKTVAIIEDSGVDVLLVAWSLSGAYFGLADHVPAGTTRCNVPPPGPPTWATVGDCTNGW